MAVPRRRDEDGAGEVGRGLGAAQAGGGAEAGSSRPSPVSTLSVGLRVSGSLGSSQVASALLLYLPQLAEQVRGAEGSLHIPFSLFICSCVLPYHLPPPTPRTHTHLGQV